MKMLATFCRLILLLLISKQKMSRCSMKFMKDPKLKCQQQNRTLVNKIFFVKATLYNQAIKGLNGISLWSWS